MEYFNPFTGNIELVPDFGLSTVVKKIEEGCVFRICEDRVFKAPQVFTLCGDLIIDGDMELG